MMLPIRDGCAATPLVGREAELRIAREALDRARDGHGQVVLLAGEPGIGKTRTSEEIASLARGLGAQMLTSRCFEWSGAPAYWPWKQAFNAYLDAQGAADVVALAGRALAPLAPILPRLGEALHDEPAPPASSPEHERVQLFEAAAALLHQAADQELTVIVLDDLHWADAPSLLLLEFLAPAIRESRALILGAYRDTEVVPGEALSRTLGNLVREPNVERLPLRRLLRAEVADFVSHSTGRRSSGRLAGKVYESSEGNPLFMTEIVRMLSGAFGPEWMASALAREVRLPASLRDAILQRVKRLPAECHRVLSAAAVIGRDFRLPLLRDVTDLGMETVLAALEPALRARIVEPGAGPGEYLFSHVLIQGAVYDEISTLERARLHARVVAALERGRSDLSAHLPELAYHAYQAAPLGDLARAVDYAVQAGDQAVGQVAWESAIEHYQRALALLDLDPAANDEQRCDVLLALGAVQWTAGDPSDAEQTFQLAAVLARRLNAPERLARAALGIAGTDVVGTALKDRVVVPILEEALAALSSKPSLLAVRLLCQLCYLSTGADRIEQQRRYAGQALEMARQLDDDACLLQALDAQWYALQGPDRTEEREAIADEQLRVAERAGDRYAEMMGYGSKASDSEVAGDIRAYAEYIGGYERCARELKLSVHLLGSAFNRAILLAIDGRLGEAEHVLDQIPTERIEALPDGGGNRMLTLLRLVICREQERLHEIVDHFDDLPKGVLLGGEWHGQIERALVYLELGDERPARETLERRGANSLADVPRDAFWIAKLARAAELVVRLGDRERAAALYELLREYADLNVVAGLSWICYGAVAHTLGLLATLLGHDAAAQAHFERALTLHQRMGARLFLAQTQVAYAAFLAGRDQPGDRARALGLAEEALATAEPLRLLRLGRQARELVEALTAVGRASVHGLSARELEVLRLLVEGLSDREIGERLYISHRTVMRHVTHILDKLEVNSRTAAAAAAIRRGIV